MASKKGTSTPVETQVNEMDSAWPLSYGDWKVEDAKALPVASMKHLFNLGFSTALKNSIAGVKAGLKGESKTEDNNWTDEEIVAYLAEKNISAEGDLRSDEVVSKILAAYQKEMFESILSGNIGLGGRGGPRGPRLSPDEKLLREVAIWYLERLVQQLGKAMPKNTVEKVVGDDGKETKVRSNKLDEAIAKVLESPKHRPAIDEEFARRKAAPAVAEGAGDFLDELLG
jgi:hypothetical protein